MNDKTRTTDHPSDELLAAFLDRTLDGDDLDRLLAHLDECAHCRATVSAASGALAEHAERPPLRWLGPLVAAAAAVVLLLVPVSHLSSPPTRVPVVRGEGGEGVARVAAVAPRDEQLVQGRPVFEWASAGEDATYVLMLTDEVGDLVWSERTADTRLALPDSVELEAGRYHWVVDALLARAREATTGAHAFRVSR